MNTGLILPGKPIPQLYGDPYGCQEINPDRDQNDHKGSCLSASFEMVDAYQGKGVVRSYSTISCYPGKSQPNDDDHYYCWNQATIHHYVWSNKKRLLELATSEISWGGHLEYSVMTVSKPGERPTWTMRRVVHTELREPDIPDYYWDVVKAALDCNRMPLVSVKSMRMMAPRPMPSPEDWDYEEQYDWIPIPTHLIPEPEVGGFPNDKYPLYEEKDGWGPLYGISEGVFEECRPGHAMVISGYMIENEGPLEERYVRLLDPSPSMRLRANPMQMYNPDLYAKDPRNHIKWVRWKDLEGFIRNKMGLLIFSRELRMPPSYLNVEWSEKSRGNTPITW